MILTDEQLAALKQAGYTTAIRRDLLDTIASLQTKLKEAEVKSAYYEETLNTARDRLAVNPDCPKERRTR
jgi:hypothetical protein